MGQRFWRGVRGEVRLRVRCDLPRVEHLNEFEMATSSFGTDFMKQPYDHKWKIPGTQTAIGKYNVSLITPVHRILSVLAKLPITATYALRRFVCIR